MSCIVLIVSATTSWFNCVLYNRVPTQFWFRNSRTFPGLFQDISGHFPGFWHCSSIQKHSCLIYLLCYSQYNNSLQYWTSSQAQGLGPNSRKGVRGYHPRETVAILCRKMMHFGVFWKNSRTFPGHFCKMFKFQDFSRTFPQIIKFQDFSRTSLNSRTLWEPCSQCRPSLYNESVIVACMHSLTISDADIKKSTTKRNRQQPSNVRRAALAETS